MQQCAVPWLHGITLRNDGEQPLRDLCLRIEVCGFVAAREVLLDELQIGERRQLEVPDLSLPAEAFANQIERSRADLVVTVTCGEELLLREVRAIDVLAYNEWPGLQDMPALLAAFVMPNHPALTPVLHAVAERLEQVTGDAALNGYQSGDASRVRAMLGAVHDAICAVGIRYVSSPPSFEGSGQKIRLPEQVVGERLATCLDLTLLYAAVLEHIGLQPILVVQNSHAFVGVWLSEENREKVAIAAGIEVRKAVAAGTVAVLESTMACVVPTQSHARAVAAAEQRLLDEKQFRVALDVAAARRTGIRPLPVRTSTYAAVVGDLPALQEVDGSKAVLPQPVIDPLVLSRTTPKDRLEHWQQKLLDLSMFNRLLNFVETKKTVRLAAHDLGDIEDRLQSGARMRLHGKPDIGDAKDPRDLNLEAQRSGQDLMAEYLQKELRAGRWRCDFDDENLDTRLIEIFRHARTSLEESGANTLYLAVGYLRWYESADSQRPRRAPLLLVPIVIERLSVQEGFRFVMDDAEARVNTTLLQMLERDFELTVPIGEQLPEDERGVDVSAVLDIFRRTALAMPRWEVEDVACVGFFSFTKYLMWLDLKNRDELLQSKVLQHLVDAPGAALLQDIPEYARDELDDLHPEDVFCPKDADSSQLSAVMAGSLGRSFVLEGPPGTGKSQTITNLIAQSLANGRRVLFVAEKRAALEVVYQRLADVGLGPFCLELHSSKSGPKAVLEQLRATLELGHRRAPSDWQQVATDLQTERTALNDFVLSLHKRREHGWSVHQAMSQLVHLREAKRLPLPELLAGKPEDVTHAQQALEALIVASGRFGVPDKAPWWGVQRGDWTPAVERDVVPMAERLHVAALAMRDALSPVVATLGLSAVFGELPVVDEASTAAGVGPSATQLATLLELLRALQAPSLPPAAWLQLSNWREFDEDLERAIAYGHRRDDLWDQLAPRWRRDLLDLDLGTLAASYRLHAESFVLFRWWRLRAHKQVVAGVATASLPSAVSIRDDLDLALRVRDEERLLQACSVAMQGLAGDWRDSLADWQGIDRSLQQTREIRQLILRLLPGSLQPDRAVLDAVAQNLLALADGASPLPQLCGTLFTAHDELQAARSQVQNFLELSLPDAFGEDDAPDYLAQVERRAAGWLQHRTSLRDHCAYRRAAETAHQASLTVLVDQHACGALLVHELRPAYERSLYEGWLDLVHRREPSLAMFRGQDHEAAIARFAELDRQSIELGAKVVVARLAAKLPQLRDTQVASSELGVLERELKKQRRHKPVRRLLSEIRGLWPKLSPCVLMSPMSVAQYLSRDAQRFDLVVFDEASQIPMWDAVGAIGRGDSLIVVGDSKQLPPTNFFQRAAEGDDGNDDQIPEDLESVLDECGAAGLPRMHLDWHYRSRHESLIAFSNHYYYQNRLLTFPAPRAASDGAGVRCVRVDGVYDRAGTQQNRIEADALVATVVKRLRNPYQASLSMGIVTFSRAQQTLIEDLLDAERRADPSLEQALLTAAEELFVKNLENVQGDERDVILFSICYGPDAAGKIYENYGPLNQQGGERRLNVAVTRARRELIVFSSVGPEQIANRTQATGARHLRYFLDYAMRGEAALIGAVEHDPSREVDSPFEASVRDELRRRGHEVHCQVGCSGYRIDLAIVDPEAPGRYLIGLECDGATYHSAATARDRDRLRASVLRSLGWQLSRIWSTDYWHDPGRELDRIEGEIELARTALREVDAARIESSVAPPDVAVADAGEAVVDESVIDESEVEAPVSAEATIEQSSPASEPQAAGDEPAPESLPEDDAAPEQVIEAPHDPDGPRPYVPADVGRSDSDQQMAISVLAVEAPIAFDRLVRTLAGKWDVNRVTDRVRERVRSALPAAAVEDDGVLWNAAEQRGGFRGFRVPRNEQEERAIDELPIVEVVSAMAWLLRQHHALASDDLAREAARCFGIQRLGSVVRQVMGRALERLQESGQCERDGETVRLPS
ncbi:MAG: very-short-patch-repair endonuclease [Planctomycetota bacterium]|jgi:very-short-patch-repair endonuclease